MVSLGVHSTEAKLGDHAGQCTCRTSRESTLAGRRGACYNVRMNMTLKITKVGNSAGLVLPKELLAQIGAEIGGTLSVVRTPRGIELAVEKPDFEAQMEAAREVMARRKRALRELAK